MRHIVADASVILKWFRPTESDGDAARALRAEFEVGELSVTAPTLLPLEVVNVLGRRWHLPPDDLITVAGALDDLSLDLVDAELIDVAAWVNRGLTAYDAAYLAVAEELDIELVTADMRVVAAAPDIARPLASI